MVHSMDKKKCWYEWGNYKILNYREFIPKETYFEKTYKN